VKIFGREPALVISMIGGLVTLLVALNIPGLSAGVGAAITTFVAAAIIAVTTRPVAPALFTAVVSAGAALFTQYGLHVSDGVVAAVSAVTLTGFALFGIRPQVTPSADPRPIDGTPVSSI
jgi:methyl coenzyme M reductase beta subunit